MLMLIAKIFVASGFVASLGLLAGIVAGGIYNEIKWARRDRARRRNENG